MEQSISGKPVGFLCDAAGFARPKGALTESGARQCGSRRPANTSGKPAPANSLGRSPHRRSQTMQTDHVETAVRAGEGLAVQRTSCSIDLGERERYFRGRENILQTGFVRAIKQATTAWCRRRETARRCLPRFSGGRSICPDRCGWPGNTPHPFKRLFQRHLNRVEMGRSPRVAGVSSCGTLLSAPGAGDLSPNGTRSTHWRNLRSEVSVG
jgi:hypothetical protein